MIVGDFTAADLAKLWDMDSCVALLSEFALDDQLPVTVDGDDLDALLALAEIDQADLALAAETWQTSASLPGLLDARAVSGVPRA